jgi:hypothetical protein
MTITAVWFALASVFFMSTGVLVFLNAQQSRRTKAALDANHSAVLTAQAEAREARESSVRYQAEAEASLREKSSLESRLTQLSEVADAR